MIMTDSPIRFPGLFGDWAFTASSKAINIGHGIYWYGIIIACGLLLAVRVDGAIIGGRVEERLLVALCPGKLSANGNYTALIGADG